MSKSSHSEIMLIEATPTQAAEKPRPRNSGPNPEKAGKAAIRRCCAAYNRAYEQTLENQKNAPEEGVDPAELGVMVGNEVLARHHGREAFREAMPVLAGIDGIRDFVACVAHGILNETIQTRKFGPLLYAAQVALSAFNSAPPPEKR